MIKRIIPPLLVVLATLYAPNTVQQHGDGYGGIIHKEIKALTNNENTLTANNDFNVPVTEEKRCGMFGNHSLQRHYGILSAYIQAYGTKLFSLPPDTTTTLFISLSIYFFLFFYSKNNIVNTSIIILLLCIAPYASLGYGGYLQYPIEFGWDLASLFLLAGSILSPYPYILLPITSILAHWLSGLVFVQAGVIAGVCIARYGFSIKTIQLGLLSVYFYSIGWLLHIFQLYCYAGWDFAVLYDIYFKSEYGYGLLFRISTLSLYERFSSLIIWFPKYLSAMFLPQWATTQFWLILSGVLVLLTPSRNSIIGAIFVLLGLVAYHMILPMTLPFHLHLMVRVFIIVIIFSVMTYGIKKST